MTKICLVIHSLGLGGMERVMSELANWFVNHKKAEVHLILIGIKREVAYPIQDEIQIHIPPFAFNNKLRTLSTFRTIFFLRKKINQLEADAVLSFGEMWNNLVLLSLYKQGTPVFVSDRSQPNKNLGRLHNYLREKLYPLAKGVIAQTASAKSICKSRKWNNCIKVIGNPIREINDSTRGQKENIILSVGRLIKTKHFDQLIQMFSLVKKTNWKLIIVGGDSKKQKISEELVHLIEELKIQDSVLLEGAQSNVEKYYNSAKIFAFTSSSEGFPNVVGEAMSAGLPVIAYDCLAGPADMIKNGINGYLIPLFDQKTFKEKLNLLMNDNALREQLGSNAKGAIQQFNVPVIADQFYTFITKNIS